LPTQTQNKIGNLRINVTFWWGCLINKDVKKLYTI